MKAYIGNAVIEGSTEEVIHALDILGLLTRQVVTTTGFSKKVSEFKLDEEQFIPADVETNFYRTAFKTGTDKSSSNN